MFMEIAIALVWTIAGFAVLAGYLFLESFIAGRKADRQAPREIINFRATNW